MKTAHNNSTTHNLKNTHRRLQKHLLRHKWQYLIGFIAVIVVDVIQLKIPIITGQITDGLQAGHSKSELLNKILLLLTIGILISIIRFIWRYFIFGTSRKIECEMRNDFFHHLTELSLRFFHESKTGDLMAYANNDINAIRMMIGPGLIMGIDAIFMTALIVYQMMTQISINLTLVAIIPFPFIAVSSLLFGKNMRRRFKDKQEAFAHMSDMVQENISGIRVIKAFVQETKEIIAFNKVNQNNYEQNMRVVKLQSIMMPLALFVTGLSVAVVLGYGGYLAMIGKISLGDNVAFLQYLLMMVWPMIAFGWCINIYSQGSASLTRYNEILNIPPDVKDESTLESVPPIKGDIEFRNLTFSYPNSKEQELKNITLTIRQGETLGIVGRTGSGKTTLIHMLLRMYNPKRGTVFIDGMDILDIPLKTLRDALGYVPQDNFLFSDTIANNVTFGKNDATNEEIEEAAIHANVHDNIIEFTEKYDTIVGERGVTVSGGQKQRLSIARALIKKPAILILDDAVSAVDTHTEEEILNYLKEDRKNKTTIIIAHRISTLQNSDQIIVIDDGRIIECGNHNELMEKKGMYFDLVKKQQLEKELLEQD